MSETTPAKNRLPGGGPGNWPHEERETAVRSEGPPSSLGSPKERRTMLVTVRKDAENADGAISQPPASAKTSPAPPESSVSEGDGLSGADVPASDSQTPTSDSGGAEKPDDARSNGETFVSVNPLDVKPGRAVVLTDQPNPKDDGVYVMVRVPQEEAGDDSTPAGSGALERIWHALKNNPVRITAAIRALGIVAVGAGWLAEDSIEQIIFVLLAVASVAADESDRAKVLGPETRKDLAAHAIRLEKQQGKG